MNFLEQLAAEWYEYQGYFVRTNVRARKRARGGWDAELDVLAFDPHSQILLHVETSGDALPWEKRRERFLTKKFVFPKAEYEELIGTAIEDVRRIAIVGYSKTPQVDLEWGEGIEVVSIPAFVAEISGTLKAKNFLKESVPEGYGLLRAIHICTAYA